jgi:metallo-beta-lactamase class B
MKRMLLALALFAATPAHAADPANWRQPAEPFRVIGNIYYVGSDGLASWLIATPQGHILIDGAMAYNAPMIEANIKALGFTPSDVKILLNSHAHMDHAGGLAQLRADTHAPLFASAGDKPLLEQGVYPGAESDKSLSFPPVKVDRVIGDGQPVSLGPVTLTAHITPGHTPGCTTWTMRVAENGEAHQVVFLCSMTVAANRLVGKPSYPGIVEDYRRAFTAARALKADVFLSAHAETYGLPRKRAALLAARKAGQAANPFVDPAAYAKAVDAAAADFETQLKAQTAALEKKP